jgi:hypothetical protein
MQEGESEGGKCKPAMKPEHTMSRTSWKVA